MNLFDNESKIIEYFQETISPSEIFLPYQSNDIENVFTKIYDITQWAKWKDSSGKDAPPPDFFSDEFSLMMDVMRVDDHSFINKRGKLINQTNAQESKTRKCLHQSSLLETFQNCKDIIINTGTNLPTEEDHNYNFYLSSFTRTITEHIRKIPLYKKNHPKHKVIFFVLDESSAYMQVEHKIPTSVGNLQKGLPHYNFYDEAFLKVFQNTNIDYLIWFYPFKLLKTDTGFLDLPKASIYNVHQMHFDFLNYDPSKMVSSEI